MRFIYFIGSVASASASCRISSTTRDDDFTSAAENIDLTPAWTASARALRDSLMSVVPWQLSIDPSETVVANEYVGDFDFYALKPEPVAKAESSVLFKAKRCLLGGDTRQGKLVAYLQNNWICRKSQYIVKFKNTCNFAFFNPNSSLDERMHSTDDLVDEFAVMTAIADLHIAPNAYGVSQPLLVKKRSHVWKNPKLRSRSLRKYFPCQHAAYVRAIVEDRVGESLLSYFFHSMVELVGTGRMIAIVQAGLQTIHLIQQLHTAGFLHNDIHKGNVAFRDRSKHTNTTLSPLVLIDFGYAEFFPFCIGKPEAQFKIAPDDEHLNKILLSPWHIQGMRSGRRDDVYRVVEMLADLLTIGWENSLYDALFGSGNVLVEARLLPFKMNRAHFTGEWYSRNKNPRKLDTICNLHLENIRNEDPHHCDRAMRLLDDAMNVVRTQSDVDSQPDYDRIKRLLTDAVAELQQLN